MTSVALGREARAVVETAELKAVDEELASVKEKMAASRVKGTNSLWSAHNIAKTASKTEDDVSKALMAVSREVADGTKRKVPTIVLEQKDGLMRLLTHIEI